MLYCCTLYISRVSDISLFPSYHTLLAYLFSLQESHNSCSGPMCHVMWIGNNWIGKDWIGVAGWVKNVWIQSEAGGGSAFKKKCLNYLSCPKFLGFSFWCLPLCKIADINWVQLWKMISMIEKLKRRKSTYMLILNILKFSFVHTFDETSWGCAGPRSN